MGNTKNFVLVLWDFSEASNNALLHAIQLAKVAGNELLLLNIIPSEGLFKNKDLIEEKINESLNKLKEIAQEIKKENNITPYLSVREGSTSRIIKDVTIENKVNLILAGKDILFGKKPSDSISLLMKSLKDISIPFIVTDFAPAHSHYIEIVVPLDYDKKYKETLHWMIYLSKLYKCNINLIKPYLSDEGKKKNMANNIFFTKKMLDANKIIYGIKTAKKINDFNDEIFKFANMIEADLILIMADKYSQYSEHDIDGADKVPIMCVNPRTRKFQSFT